MYYNELMRCLTFLGHKGEALYSRDSFMEELDLCYPVTLAQALISNVVIGKIQVDLGIELIFCLSSLFMEHQSRTRKRLRISRKIMMRKMQSGSNCSSGLWKIHLRV